MKRPIKKSKKGFTLIELIIVIAILAILALIAIPAYNAYRERADNASRAATAKIIYDAALVADTSPDPASTTGGTLWATWGTFIDPSVNVSGYTVTKTGTPAVISVAYTLFDGTAATYPVTVAAPATGG